MKQREIKFRAWSDVDKTMYYSDNKDNLKFVFYPDDWLVMTTHNRVWSHNSFSKKRRTSKDIIMQYTGLKDKNGQKEIYVGDIVDIGHNLYKFEIVFEQGCFGLLDRTATLSPFWQIDMNKLEVIGNIYENKDLLK